MSLAHILELSSVGICLLCVGLVLLLCNSQCVPGSKQTLYLSVHVNHSHTGSCDFWIVRFVAIWPRCDRSAMSATISSGGWSLTIGRTRGRAITNDWRRWMTRSVVCNRATSGSDRRPIVRQSLRPTIDRRSIVLSCD